MNPMQKKVNAVLSTVQSVSKKSVKVVGAALPIGTIVANGIQSWQEASGVPHLAINRFIRKYTGVDPVTGKFYWDDLMIGTGSLIVAGAAGAVLNMLA